MECFFTDITKKENALTQNRGFLRSHKYQDPAPLVHRSLFNVCAEYCLKETASNSCDRLAGERICSGLCSFLLSFPLPLVTEGCSGLLFGRMDMVCLLINSSTTMSLPNLTGLSGRSVPTPMSGTQLMTGRTLILRLGQLTKPTLEALDLSSRAPDLSPTTTTRTCQSRTGATASA